MAHDSHKCFKKTNIYFILIKLIWFGSTRIFLNKGGIIETSGSKAYKLNRFNPLASILYSEASKNIIVRGVTYRIDK